MIARPPWLQSGSLHLPPFARSRRPKLLQIKPHQPLLTIHQQSKGLHEPYKHCINIQSNYLSCSIMQTPNFIRILVDTADKPAEFRALMRDLILTDEDLPAAIRAAEFLADSLDPRLRESGEALLHKCAFRKRNEVSYWFVRCLLDRFRLPRQH